MLQTEISVMQVLLLHLVKRVVSQFDGEIYLNFFRAGNYLYPAS